MCVRYFNEDNVSITTNFLCVVPVIAATAASLFNTTKIFLMTTKSLCPIRLVWVQMVHQIFVAVIILCTQE